MTEENARTTANVVLVTAGAAAAFVVMTKPPLRRFAWRALRYWIGASLPIYLITEAREAWVESGRRA